ncbi:hypothetical protein QQF64_031189 [Cirrhinus molitorella]|uniref:Ig-like domain-containing protein n=1 Tax=Cirrhinus molitorella TaxID=172907 RepID=A0ABR3N5K8_9TELE
MHKWRTGIGNQVGSRQSDMDYKPQLTLTINPQSSVFTGDTVTLSCDVKQSTGWTIHWRKGSNPIYIDAANKQIESVSISDGGMYQCKAQRGDYHSKFSKTIILTVTERPKPIVHVDPDENVFRGETVTLTCDIQGTQGWQYNWYKDRNQNDKIGQNQKYIIRPVDWSHSGVYSCKGTQKKALQYSQMSDGVTLTVETFQPTLTVSPQSSVFTGDTVTLSCNVGRLTGWTIIWYKGSNHEISYNTVKTITSVSNYDEGKYECIAQQGDYYSKYSNTVEITVKERPKPVVSVQPDENVFIGETVTLICHILEKGDWQYSWYKGSNQNYILQHGQEYAIPSVDKSYGDVYSCKGTQSKSAEYSQKSDGVTLTVSDLPTPTLTPTTPINPVFTGETTSERYTVNGDTLTIKPSKTSDGGQYWCRGHIDGRSVSSKFSSAVSLSVKDLPKSSLTVAPDSHVFTGETVNLKCVIEDYSDWIKRNYPSYDWRYLTSEWRYEWYKGNTNNSIMLHTSQYYTVNRDTLTIRGATGSDQGQYWCRGQRDKRPKSSQSSSAISLIMMDFSASVSLVVSPSRSQHFSSDSLSLSCEDQSNSAGWTVRRHTVRNTEDCSKQTGSTCRIISLNTSDTGVYWCQSESGEKSHPQNITVHDGDVILVSSVDPVIEGDTLTLHCLHRSTNSSILRADFYKDGSLVQNQTTGEMNIITVSKSHEGFYYCKTERGQSLHSWISVREKKENYTGSEQHGVSHSAQISVFNILTFLLAACPYLLSTVVLLLKCYRARDTSTEDQNQYAVTEEETSI